MNDTRLYLVDAGYLFLSFMLGTMQVKQKTDKKKKGMKTPQSKYVFILLFIALLAFAAWTIYLQVNTVITRRFVESNKQQIASLTQEITNFSLIPGFDKFQSVVKLENSLQEIPWSRHIQMVSQIFEDVVSTDVSETSNIILSDFHISLDEISVHGYVTNLRILYVSPDPLRRPSLIERFEQLPFLTDISIKNYERDSSGVGYNFTLTAKVINNDDE